MDIPFSIKTKYGNYNDVLFFPDEAPPTEEELKAAKQARVEAWARRILKAAAMTEEAIRLYEANKIKVPPVRNN